MVPLVPSQAGLDFQGALQGKSQAKFVVPITALKTNQGEGTGLVPLNQHFLHMLVVCSHTWRRQPGSGARGLVGFFSLPFQHQLVSFSKPELPAWSCQKKTDKSMFWEQKNLESLEIHILKGHYRACPRRR